MTDTANAPDQLVVIWTSADEDTMPATVSAHTPKSRDFEYGAPRWMEGKRLEYVLSTHCDELVAAAWRDIADTIASINGVLADPILAKIVSQLRAKTPDDARAALADAQAVGFAAGVEAAAKAADAEVSLLYKQIKDNNEFYRKNGIWDTGANTECEYRIRALKAVAEATRAITPPDATAAAARVLLGDEAMIEQIAEKFARKDKFGLVEPFALEESVSDLRDCLSAIAGDTP